LICNANDACYGDSRTIEASRFDRSSLDIFDIPDMHEKREAGLPRDEPAASMQERLTATPLKFTKFVRRRA
jgi:hypothetical protein